MVGETEKSLVIAQTVAFEGEGPYFFPRQFRGPIEKGWKISLRSLSYPVSGSQRSGTKDFGSLKLIGDIYAG